MVELGKNFVVRSKDIHTAIVIWIYDDSKFKIKEHEQWYLRPAKISDEMPY